MQRLLAASWALSMLAAGKRENGRWAYGANSENCQNSDNLNREMKARLGVIADHAPDLLIAVRDDDLSLNTAEVIWGGPAAGALLGVLGE